MDSYASLSGQQGETLYDVLLCSVYNGYPDGDLELLYMIGSYRNSKFDDDLGKNYRTDYWALINEPHAWECDPWSSTPTTVLPRHDRINCR